MLGRFLGYSNNGSVLVDLIDGKWRREFIHGKDCHILKGQDLQDFKELTTPVVVSSRTPHLLLLYGFGVALTLLKTEKPIGIRVRRFLRGPDHVL